MDHDTAPGGPTWAPPSWAAPGAAPAPPPTGPPQAWPAPGPAPAPPGPAWAGPHPPPPTGRGPGRRNTIVLVVATVGIFVALAAGIAVIESGRDRPSMDETEAAVDDDPAPSTAADEPTEGAPTTEAPTTTTPPTTTTAGPPTTAPPTTVPDLPTGDGRVAVQSFDSRFRWTMFAPPTSMREPIEAADGGAPIVTDIWVAAVEPRMELTGVYALGGRSYDRALGLHGVAAVYDGSVGELTETTILGVPATMGRFDMVIQGLELNGYGATVQVGDTAVFLAAYGTGDPTEQMAAYLLLVDSLEAA